MASRRPKKVLFLGLDGGDPLMVERFVRERRLPNMKRIMDMGVYFPMCLSMHPTITPPNWASYATGARPGTHGITCFWDHHSGEPLDTLHMALDSSECSAEFLWDVLDGSGKRSIVLNYPTAWPPTAKDAMVIDGTAVTPFRLAAVDNERVYRLSPDFENLHEKPSPVLIDRECEYQIAAEAHQTFDEGTQDRADVPLRHASGWRALPSSSLPPLTAQIPLVRGKVTRHVVVTAEGPHGYDTVAVYARPGDGTACLGKASLNQWSEWIEDRFDLPEGPATVNYQIKLMDIQPEKPTVQIYSTYITRVDDSCVHPSQVYHEIMEHVGPVICHVSVDDHDIRLEAQAQIHDWYGRVAQYLNTAHPWDLFYMHCHALDFANHMYITGADPLGLHPDEHETYLERLYRYYKLVDDMVGQYLDFMDEETLLFVVSDHGAVTRSQTIPELGDPHSVGGNLLEKWGFLSYKKAGNRPTIDWSQTKAICQRSSYIYINLKGRDPQGIVRPEEYDRLVNELIDRLYDYEDPTTGEHPVALALSKQDMPNLDLYGDRVGDVFYAIRPGYSRIHGNQVATGRYGNTSVRCLFTMAGPGVKQGVRIDRIVRPIDVVPTICWLTGWPIPAQTEGAVLYQALTDD